MNSNVSRGSVAAPLGMVDILIIGSESVAGSSLRQLLEGWHLTNRVVEGLAGVLKATRLPSPPRAVILDAASPGFDIGAEHVVRMLRNTRPNLSIIALCAAPCRAFAAVAAEFKLPLVATPIEPANLAVALRGCGLNPAIEAS